MSYDDLYANSEARKTIEKRKEVNFISLGGPYRRNEWCLVCRRILKPYKPGTLICPSCGVETSLKKLKQKKKLMSKLGSNVNTEPILISQKKRSDRQKHWTDSINQGLTEEDKADLRGAGFMI